MTEDKGESESSAAETADEDSNEANASPPAVGEYTWRDFMREHGHADEIEAVYRDVDTGGSSGGMLSFLNDDRKRVPTREDWERADFDPVSHLGFPPSDVHERLGSAASEASALRTRFERWVDATPVVKDAYTWEHFKWEYYYDESGYPPRDSSGEVEPFEPSEHLGFDPDDIESVLADGADAAE
ncbi:MAG: flagellar protein FlaI, partial [Natronomonas sp.]